MKDQQGYFSLIQYSEFPERNEFVSIGIAVFVADEPSVRVKFSKSAYRVEKIFDVHLGSEFEVLKRSMENRLFSEFRSSWKKSDIDKFIAMRSGKIRFSAAKSVLVNNADELIDQLFSKLVMSPEKISRMPKALVKLKHELIKGGVESFLDKPKPIELPQGVTIKAPYAYQNGSYNLISAISLRDDPDLAISRASKYAVEGHWLSDVTGRQKKMIVVGDLSGQQQNFVKAIEGLMESNKVGFFDMHNLNPLIADIKEHSISYHG